MSFNYRNVYLLQIATQIVQNPTEIIVFMYKLNNVLQKLYGSKITRESLS